MNEVGARASPVFGGYRGEFRKVHRADWEAVCVNGIPQVYPTAQAAELAAWRALHAHLCGEIVGDGYKAEAQRTKAEELFGALIKNGKKIPVVRK
mgnify:CR=1 FL=1